MSTLLQIENAVFAANGKPVIDSVSFTVPEGSCLCIVGPSGSGKSSLLRLFNRLNVKTSGEILFKGEPIESVPVPTLRRRIGMVFQKTTVFSGTVADNLRMVLDLAGKKPGEMLTNEERFAMLAAVKAAGLTEDDLQRNAQTMSGGEQQRVGIARALMSQPDVLLMDEPTASLDVEAIGRVLQTVKSLRGKCTVLMVNHHLEEVEAVATHVLMLDKGRIVELADTDTFFKHPESDRLKAFLAAYRRTLNLTEKNHDA